jgi:hypothetical protein
MLSAHGQWNATFEFGGVDAGTLYRKRAGSTCVQFSNIDRPAGTLQLRAFCGV